MHATLVVFGLIAIAAYLFQLDLPRSYLLVMMPAGLTAVLASRFVWRRWLHHRRDLGEYMSQVLAVGNIHTVTELLRDLRRAPRAGYKVIGVCVSQPSSAGARRPVAVHRRRSGTRRSQFGRGGRPTLRR